MSSGKGRPKKMAMNVEDIPVRVGTTISKKYWDMVPGDVTWKELLEEIIAIKFSNKEQYELRKIKDEKDKLEVQLAKLKILESEIEHKQQSEEEVRKQIKQTSLYLEEAFKMIYHQSGKDIGKITMYPEAIERLYGITFNVEKANKHFSELPAIEDIVSFLHIQKLNNHAKKENEILARIERDEE